MVTDRKKHASWMGVIFVLSKTFRKKTFFSSSCTVRGFGAEGLAGESDLCLGRKWRKRFVSCR